MSARQKLDAASIQGGLIVAALVGALVQSGSSSRSRRPP